MASYEGYRLVQQSTSLSTQMPAAFLQWQFLVGARIQHYGRSDQGSAERQRAVSRQYHPDRRASRRLRRNCSNTTRRRTSPAWPAISPCRCRPPPDTTRPWTASIRISATRSGSMCAPTGRSGTRSAAMRSRSTARPRRPTVTNYTFGYTHTLTPNLVNDFRVGRNFFNTATRQSVRRGRTTPLPARTWESRASTATPSTTIPASPTSTSPASTDSAAPEPTGIRTTAPPALRTDQLDPRFAQHHGRRGVSQAGHRPGRCQQRARHFYLQRNADPVMRRPISSSGHPVSFATAGPEIRGRVAGWRDGFFVLDKWQVSRKLTLNYGIRYELPTVPYTINGVASILNADQSALIVATPGFKFIAPQHKNWAPRLGFAYRINDKTVFRGGGGIYYNPNQTNSYTFLNTNPPWSPIFQCNWSAGLPTLSLSNPLGRAGGLPASRQQQRRSDRHAPGGTAHRPHESVERQPGAPVVERRRSRGAVSRLALLSPGPQLLQQHAAASGTRRRQLAPAESDVWPHPHHRQRRNRQLREHERHFPHSAWRNGCRRWSATPGRTRWMSPRTPMAEARR